MTPSDQTPKLPTWIFIVADLAFIGAAGAIAWGSSRPFSDIRIFAIVLCLILGAIFGLVPIIAYYEREKNETLDDRQRALEALSRTISSSAEQISIAANGLHEIAELSLKNLRHAEHLPQKLSEKIAEFQAQLAVANDAEKDELEKELAALRTTESDRLESISDKIAKSAADWAKLEAATQKNLAAATATVERAASDALAQLTAATVAATAATTAAISQAAEAASSSIAQASASSGQSLAAATLDAEQSLARAQTRVTGELDEKLAAAGRAVATGTTEALATFETKLAAGAERIERALAAAAQAAPVVETATPPPSAPDTPPPLDEPVPVLVEAIPEVAPVAPQTSDPFPAPETTAEVPEPTAAPAIPAAEPVAPAEPVAAAAAPEPVAPEPVAAPEPAPTEPIVETPAVTAAPQPEPPTTPAPEAAAAPAAADDEEPKASRKRVAKKAEPDEEPEPALGLEMDDTPAPQSAELAERVLTSDGATRLVVTAYIGIGNRLFIRGEGPGLSWEKGVPLQFVSIGKWRWETSDATEPVSFKLYKNDSVECTALGPQNLDPGHQQELTASF